MTIEYRKLCHVQSFKREFTVPIEPIINNAHATMPGAAFTASASGDSCVILDFGNTLDMHTNHLAARAATLLNAAWRNGRLGFVTDIVPAMVTVGIHYRLDHPVFLGSTASPFATLCQYLCELLDTNTPHADSAPRRIEIPVCYGDEYGPDLAEVASRCGVSAGELIDIHSGEWWDVLMLGFAPGHPHIGILDPRLSPPRRATPRTLVKRGSVGLANRQSVIYPADLPGGWSLIGRTPLAMFNPALPSPCLLQAADKVRFIPIDAATFKAMSEEQRA